MPETWSELFFVSSSGIFFLAQTKTGGSWGRLVFPHTWWMKLALFSFGLGLFGRHSSDPTSASAPTGDQPRLQTCQTPDVPDSSVKMKPSRAHKEAHELSSSPNEGTVIGKGRDGGKTSSSVPDRLFFPSALRHWQGFRFDCKIAPKTPAETRVTRAIGEQTF